MSRHLIVISQDAMVCEDIEKLKTLPNFGKIWEKASWIKRVRSIYPTVTYPCHATMMTGVYPDKHGIINNEQLIMGQAHSKWTHFREAVKAKTVFDYAKEHGLTTASVFWPVTGNDQSIDYLIDEYWPQSPGESDAECFVNSGSSEEVMEKIVRPNLHFVAGRARQHPYCDQFVMACAADMIRCFQPNLLLVHPANIDSCRHHSGLYTPLVEDSLHMIDLWFGDILNAVKDAGIYDDTDFVITSDHGQMTIVRTMSPNVVFADHGLITADAQGNFIDYKAFCKSAGMSAQVFLKNPDDKETEKAVYDLLCHMRDEGIYGISRVFTKAEAAAEHLAGGFSFVIETDGYSSFTNEWTRPIVRPFDVTDYRFGHATHGYYPEKGPQPTLFAFGPHIKEGVTLESAKLVDHAPTYLKILGIDMENTDGHAVTDIIR